jgi:ribosomal protein S27AE
VNEEEEQEKRCEKCGKPVKRALFDKRLLCARCYLGLTSEPMSFPHHWIYGVVLICLGMSLQTGYLKADWLLFKDIFAWLFVFAGTGLVVHDLHEHQHLEEAHGEDLSKVEKFIRGFIRWIRGG